ncbi:hypothetical protein GQ44DRAFT_605728 [Phaeosphaeriaceae sp. PMI808]|nr:hypothetical protein GQ44DRAFT_605728 [Phaeosphaeriaceae sp. PMI808]
MPPRRDTFFPRADAAVLQSKHEPPLASSRPTTVAPILDVENASRALNTWSVEAAESVYPTKDNFWAPAPIPPRLDCPQQCAADRYLFPVLTRNEWLRLTMLFYYTRGALEDQELMSRLQEKVVLARETVGWEFVIAGLLSHNTYTRMVTVGLPLAVLPRRESTCAHTVNQPPGTVFSLLNMIEDWRFKESPHVAEGGLRAYAGVPLRFETEYGQHVAFGSLCVASNAAQAQLSEEQQIALARLADWIVSDIIHSARARRQVERRRMLELTSRLQKLCEDDASMEEVIIEALQEVYPTETVGIYKSSDGHIHLEGGTDFQTSSLEHGLWEDSEYFEYMIEEVNHQDLIAPGIVRIIATQCKSHEAPIFLLVGSKNFRHVFDDIDAGFVQTCAVILSRYWQGRALKEALKAKDTFLRGITHQLRTPIHGILGSAELLTEELISRKVMPSTTASSPMTNLDTEQADPHMYIKTIRTSARELISTVNSLIKLNQWAGLAEAQRKTSLHQIDQIESSLLNEVSTILPQDVPARPSIIFQHNLPGNCDSLEFDMRLFIDCVQPLVVNAVQNTPGGVVAVTFSLTDDLKCFTVDVEDNGRGIELINHDRIFNAYDKVDIHTIGAGLGLTLSCKSASLMNGNISLVRSAVGKGSHFRAVFYNPKCASSLPRRPPTNERFVQIPPTFHRLSSPSRSSAICHHFSQFLINSGYSESTNLEGSLVVLDYTSSLNQLQNEICLVPSSQVAICLVPDVESGFPHFESNKFYRQNNILFVQGPFLQSVLEKSLKEADAILAEIAASSLNSGSCLFGGISINLTETPTPPTDRPVLPLHRGSIFTSAIETKLALSLGALKVSTEILSTAEISSRVSNPMALLVDDNAVNLRLLEMYCTRRNITCRTAKDGAEAVRIFADHRVSVDDRLLRQPLVTQPFTLVLMDLQMPVCDGIDATKQIRTLEQKHNWQRSVIFIVTGQDSALDRSNAIGAGSDGYLVKPVGPKGLDKWIKQWFPHAELG